MRTRTRSALTAPRAAAARPAAAMAPADWLAQQLAVCNESTAVLMRGLESMRQIQAQAMQQASARHAAAAGQPGDGGSQDILAYRAGLLRHDMEDAARCWQELCGAAIEINAELWGCATHLVNTEDAFNATSRLFHA